jgi:CSLREA domain-containing protein
MKTEYRRYLIMVSVLVGGGALWLFSVCIAPTTLASPAVNGAVITVDTTTDELNADGDCSLREAVQSANLDVAVDSCVPGAGADRIVLPPGTYRLSITGVREVQNASGDLNIRSDVVLVGASITETILHGNQLDRVLHITTAVRVEIADLTITGGHSPNGSSSGCGPTGDMRCEAGDGGAIYNAGQLTVTRVIVQNSFSGDGGAEGDVSAHPMRAGYGGGIYNAGDLVLRQSSVQKNQGGTGLRSEVCEASPGAHGGGIYSQGTLTLISSTVSNNVAGRTVVGNCAPGNAASDGAPGGGIYNTGTGSIAQSTLFANSTLNGGSAGGSHGAGGDGGDGGGLYNTGHLRIENSTFSQNRTGAYGHGFCNGDGGNGAGIFNSGTVTLTHSTLAANQTGGEGSPRAASPTCGEAGKGGGIYNTGVAYLYNTLVGGNHAPELGDDCAGIIHSMDYNLFATTDGCSPTGLLAHSWLDVTPYLDGRSDNGGPTPTHALQGGSPAINHGTCTDLHGDPVLVDQRGEPRPQGNTCDIGAYEAASHVVFQPVIWQ